MVVYTYLVVSCVNTTRGVFSARAISAECAHYLS